MWHNLLRILLPPRRTREITKSGGTARSNKVYGFVFWGGPRRYVWRMRGGGKGSGSVDPGPSPTPPPGGGLLVLSAHFTAAPAAAKIWCRSDDHRQESNSPQFWELSWTAEFYCVCTSQFFSVTPARKTMWKFVTFFHLFTKKQERNCIFLSWLHPFKKFLDFSN